MRKRIFFAAPVLLTILLLNTACNLKSTAAPTETTPVEASPTPETTAAEPTLSTPATPPVVDTPIPALPSLTATPRVVNGCAIPDGWIEYTVAPGDTLYHIAQQYGSSVDELTTGNCLENADSIRVDQIIYVPGSPTSGNTGYLEIYLIALGDNGVSGRPIGCGDSAVTQATDRPLAGSVAGNVRGMLDELFSTVTGNNTEGGIYNAFSGKNLTVRNVRLDGEQIYIEIDGTLLLTGTCEDARLQAQLLLTAFHYPQVNTAFIMIGGRNAKQLFDLSGTMPADAVFTRVDLP